MNVRTFASGLRMLQFRAESVHSLERHGGDVLENVSAQVRGQQKALLPPTLSLRSYQPIAQYILQGYECY